MRLKMNLIIFLVLTLIGANIELQAQQKSPYKKGRNTTTIRIKDLNKREKVNPMIYGQMLEDCNDKIIYGGLINKDGSENEGVNILLKDINTPIMRWPAGTYSTEYDWEKGVGPMDQRPVVPCFSWGGYESNLFGTDEFLQWCERMKIEPYINFNMGNNPDFGGGLGDALNWIDYVNGSDESLYGKKRIKNGRQEPYNVKYWGLGNENYASWGRHTAETAEVYSHKLNRWATVIKDLYSDLELIGIGHKYDWNKTVLSQNGNLIDWLSLHFYLTAWVKNGEITKPERTTYAPSIVEANLRKNIELLTKVNKQFNREDNPIQISIDEWNNRHSVFDGNENWQMQRHDERKQFDVTAIAGMLNVFIRNSPYISMANYIFPVNGHGLVRTINQQKAYPTIIYHVFKLYRDLMVGEKIDLDIDGMGINTSAIDFIIEGDVNDDVREEMENQILTYIDAAAVYTSEGAINIALINRSHEEIQSVKIDLSQGFYIANKWDLSSNSINHINTADEKMNTIPVKTRLPKNTDTITIPPCGLCIIQLTI